MTLSLASRFSVKRLPNLGQRVVYVSGPTLKGAGQVIALVPRKGGIYVRVLMDDSAAYHYWETIKVVKVQSLYEEPKP